MAELKIVKIKLNDGKTYAIRDTGAIHYDAATKKILTGNDIVDNILINDEHKFILQIGDTEATVENLLSVDRTTGLIVARDAKKVLKDIGGTSYSLDGDTGVLSLKIGSQEDTN